MSAHQQLEHVEHVEHAAGHNKQIALLIAVIALFLAFSETLGKSAQTAAISDNVEASNLWAFFQAKTIRMTTVRTAAEVSQANLAAIADPAAKAATEKQIDAWQKTAARYDDEPSTNEGRKQLAERAKEAEQKRDLALARYHHYEIASAAYQIGIVLASAAVITSMMALAYGAGLLGLIGLAFTAVGFLAPQAVLEVAQVAIAQQDLEIATGALPIVRRDEVEPRLPDELRRALEPVQLDQPRRHLEDPPLEVRDHDRVGQHRDQRPVTSLGRTQLASQPLVFCAQPDQFVGKRMR